MVILWYFITVFNKNRYFVAAIMACLSEIDFQQFENTNDINWL